MSLGGVPSFAFEELGFLSSDVGVYGNVVFRFEDMIDDIEVAHIVTVRVRIKAGAEVPIGDMREALLQKAVEQLRHSLAIADGKSAQQLVSEAREKAESERWKPDG
jgi:hypothetical protein